MIDWDGKLETVTGIPVKLGHKKSENQAEVFISGDEYSRSYLADGKHYSGIMPDIRNIPTANPATIERCVELVRRMADSEMLRNTGFGIDAKAIMAELEPVDPDEAEIDKLMSDMIYCNDDIVTEHRVKRIALTAIKRGRELERGKP